MWTWVNGIYGADVSACDRGLRFADGFFTTIRLRENPNFMWEAELWDLHLARLKKTSEMLAIKWTEQIHEYLANVLASEQLSNLQGEEYAVLRITVTRGTKGSGYAPAEDNETTIICSLAQFPPAYRTLKSTGITMGIASFRLGIQPRLAGLKTLNRTEQVMLKQELTTHEEVDELIVLDHHGFVIEATAANVFWREGEHWFTPSLQNAGVNGVSRQVLLAQNPAVREVQVPPERLIDAEEMFICNTLMELVPVRQFAGYKLPMVRAYPDAFFTLLRQE